MFGMWNTTQCLHTHQDVANLSKLLSLYIILKCRRHARVRYLKQRVYAKPSVFLETVFEYVKNPEHRGTTE